MNFINVYVKSHLFVCSESHIGLIVIGLSTTFWDLNVPFHYFKVNFVCIAYMYVQCNVV